MTMTYLSVLCEFEGSSRSRHEVSGVIESQGYELTQAQLNYPQNASNARDARDSLPSYKSAIAQSNVAGWPVESESRSIRRGWRRKDVAVGGDLDVYVPEGESHAGQLAAKGRGKVALRLRHQLARDLLSRSC